MHIFVHSKIYWYNTSKNIVVIMVTSNETPVAADKVPAVGASQPGSVDDLHGLSSLLHGFVMFVSWFVLRLTVCIDFLKAVDN